MCMILTDEFLNAQRYIGDSEADQLINSLFSTGDRAMVYESLGMADSDLVLHPSKNEVVRFITTHRSQPIWYDAEKIQAGQLVFKKFALDIMTLLGALSLPYCYAASPGNKALYQTEKMRKVPGKRLVETADFIINVLSPGSLDSGGSGHIQINKVRLIHALVRFYIGNVEWNKSWGIPINQEDMAGTNLAFSYIILVGLVRTGFKLSEQEQENFLFVWRYIGYHMHIADELLPTSKHDASLLESKIRHRHFKPSEEGRALTAELIKHYKSYFPTVPAYFVDAQIRYLLGRQLSDMLGLEREPLKDELLKSMNAVKESMNQFYDNKSAFDTMLANHATLKKQFA